MSELQTDITPDEPVVDTPVESTVDDNDAGNTADDLATSSPVEGEENTEAEADNSGHIKAINKQHRKFRDEERRANALQQELDDLKSKQAPVLPAEPITIPALPDSWDENYEQKMQQRDDAIRQNASAQAAKSQREQANAITQQQTQREEVRRTQELQDTFTGNAKKLGVSDQALQQAQDTVVGYGISPEIATAVLQDSDGPLILQHLAANPMELYDLTTGNQFEAGQKWASIKSKSAALKPSKTNAPAPATKVSGSGSPPVKAGPKGATYE